ncbi:Transmembrane emp24 domain-containing protein 10 [Rhynchospora pubera]|uniref:Transmembrane emp24 domain-containing protein 10 n=1 Tax=Rhynchospora pubera TaxID=906938 RepID=A0AAV8CNC6_9POAL|nr:Transmembrane emp24 domain-containing protein 10 [Rhynchospora pubera]
MEGVMGVLVFALLNLLALHRADALRFEIESDRTKCITEEIKKNSMSVGKYSVVGLTSEDQHITVRVTSPYVNRAGYVGHLHYAKEVESGNFAFTAMQQGDFLACFWLSKPYHNPPIRVTIDFEWKSGISSRDWKFVAKERNIIAMEKELMNMGDMVKSIHEEMAYLRERQDQFNFSFPSIRNDITLLPMFVLMAPSLIGTNETIICTNIEINSDAWQKYKLDTGRKK